MELLKEILIKELNEKEITELIPKLEEIVASKCYRALNQIKEILNDTTLDDKDCFYKIEEIVCVFEELGSNAGARHDF